MIALKETGTFPNNLVYSTCNFNTWFEKDWLLLNTSVTDSEYSIFDYDSNFKEEKCMSAISANIRGHSCYDGTVAVFQESNVSAFHIDASSSACGCSQWSEDATQGENCFGYSEGKINSKFSCTSTNSSTTQYWLGTRFENVNLVPTSVPSLQPTAAPISMCCIVLLQLMCYLLYIS